MRCSEQCQQLFASTTPFSGRRLPERSTSGAVEKRVNYTTARRVLCTRAERVAGRVYAQTAPARFIPHSVFVLCHTPECVCVSACTHTFGPYARRYRINIHCCIIVCAHGACDVLHDVFFGIVIIIGYYIIHVTILYF